MTARSASGGVIHFGPFEVDLTARELRRQGRPISLQEQPFRVLVLLLERPGQVVTRQELQQAIWPTDTFVEFDHGLNTAIKKVRQAIDDSTENPRFIETLPRQGYRFLGPVQNSQLEKSLRPNRHLLVWPSVVLSVALIGFAFVWFAIRREPEDHLESIPVTTYPGAETGPTLSPDGTQVAFTWDGEDRKNFDIYVKRIGSEAAQRLTQDPGLDFGAAWSPDGRYIAFLRPLTPDSTGVFLISPEGGVEKRVGEASVLEDFLYGPYLAWSPDSKWLFTIDKKTETPFFISLLSVETGEKRRLTYPPKEAEGDLYPTVSSDGHKLAFTRYGPGAINTLFALSLGPNWQSIEEPRAVLSDDRWIASSAWVRDDKELLFTLGPRWGEAPAVWRIAAFKNASPRRLAFAGMDACCATFSADGRRLVYSRLNSPENLYRLDLRDGGRADAPVKLASSTRISHQPDFSPDGQKIVFTSSRSGEPEIWVCDRNGRDPIKLTSFRPREIGAPRWSPDGRQIVFSMRRSGDPNSDIFTVRADGGGLNRLTKGPENHTYPAWSRNGQWIYFTFDRAGEMEVWKMRPDGHGQVLVTAHGGFAPQEAVGSDFLYIVKPAFIHWETASLWKVPLRGGPDVRVLEETIWLLNYAVTAKGIYYVPVDFGPVGLSGSKIKFLDFATGKTRQVASAAHWPGVGLAVSPDGSSLIDAEDDMLVSDVMMVENFR